MRAHYLPLERTIAAGLPSALPQSAHFQKKEEKRRKKKKKEEEEKEIGSRQGLCPISEAPKVRTERAARGASENDVVISVSDDALPARIEAENNRHPYIQRR